MNIEQQKINCRLCGGEATFVFFKKLIRYEVGFYRCNRCLSLESEKPYWLEEAYADISLIPDIGTMRRVMLMQKLVFYLCKILRLSKNGKILDWGGGNGMLVRLLRDMGLDSYLSEPYVKNLYALSFEHKDEYHYQLVTAFQVLEHFSDPATELDQIFNLQPEYVLITTALYEKQDQNWEYLNAYGRHIFCYSDKGREYIANKYGYYKVGCDSTTLFCKTLPNRLTMRLIRLILSGRFSKVLDVLQVVLPKNSALATQDRLEAFEKFYVEGKVGSVNGP